MSRLFAVDKLMISLRIYEAFLKAPNDGVSSLTFTQPRLRCTIWCALRVGIRLEGSGSEVDL